MEEASTCQWLRWAALTHEIGLVIAHSQYHKHGGYLLEYADLPGFTQRDQRILALLVRHHRRKLRKSLFENMPANQADYSIHLVALLRLSVLLHRSRSHRNTRDIRVTATTDSIKLIFPDDWIEEHPLTTADLNAEKKNLAAVGIKLKIA
jgi:exopolyphosphatase/guanosine-5'-triphosphate,3'-diphosphate pyrophosphatase